MSLIVWESRYSVGIDALDHDHIIIASLINHVDDAKQHGTDERVVGAIVKALIQQAYEHFAREEALLHRYAYPDFDRHAEAHRLLEEQLEELNAEYQRTPDPAISKEILDLLNYWLVEHILKIDMRYRDFLAAHDGR